MDSDLFMECEEEELEPWQQEEESTGNPGSASNASSTAAKVADIPPEPKTIVLPNLPPVINTANTIPLITSTMSQCVVPTAVPANFSNAVQGQQVFLAPGTGGLGTVALSQVLLPGTTNSQQIYFTTQGLPVQNIQPGQTPMSLVLNVPQGQSVQPITLVQAPGTQIFKPAVRPTQIITQPASVRAGASVVNRAQTPSSFSTLQLSPALTICTTTSVTQPSVSSLPIKTSAAIAQPSTARPTTKIVTINPGNGTLDMQNIMSLVKSVNLPPGTQSQTFVVMSNPKASDGTVVSSTFPIIPQNVIQATSVATQSKTTYLCPRCGTHFRSTDALQRHMCICCPVRSQLSDKTSAQKPPAISQKSASPVSSVKQDFSPAKTGDTGLRLVMLVDDFYYGTFEGNRVYVPTDNSKEPLLFECHSCGKKLKNNVRFMNHLKYHVELDQQNGDTPTACQHCFRRFPTPFRLQCHLESVHTSIESSTKCKICELAFESEPVFLQHMKNTHKPGEMPYVCQVCEYRSSFYSDVFNHFRTWHEDTRHLLCHYCLKVFKHASTFQQHYIRHQKCAVYHCNKCRLQFLFTKDKVEHKVTQHRTFRKPSELEGLQPGTKVTIRAYVGLKKSLGQASLKTPSSDQKKSVGTSESSTLVNEPQEGQVKKQTKRMLKFLIKFQEERQFLGRQKCVECDFDIPDFTNHFPTYVHCSRCFYSTCCARAYANHMINFHVAGRAPKASKKALPSPVKLDCKDCAYSTTDGNLMSKHLVKFPNHSHSIFYKKECLETDIEFCQVEEVEGPNEASDLGTQPDWLSMKEWSVPKEDRIVPEFMDSCGPQHQMTRNHDVLDYFQLLFPDALFEQIVSETNAYVAYCCSLGQGDASWQPISVEEVKGFFGLSILIGNLGLVEPELYWSWEQHQGRNGSRTWELVCGTMSFKRFKQIGANIRMSSMLVDNEHRNDDKLSFFQPMLSILQDSMQETYKPNKCLTIDQAFLPTHEKGRAQEKSTTTQPKIWLLCDSKSGYCHKFLVLTRQEKNKDLGKLVVPQLLEGLEGKHHNIFLSNSLASVPLMKELYGQDIYCSCSVPSQCTVLPKEFWKETPLDNPGDFKQYEFAPLLATRWKDHKELICLSTNASAGQSDVVWRRSPTKVGELCSIERPQAFKLLQDNMRGVDICNQLLTCNQLGGLVLDTNWRRLFWFLVNLSIVNSFIVLRETRKDNPPPWLPGGHFSQALYRKRLGFQLAKCAARFARKNQVQNSLLKQEAVKEEKADPQEVRHYLAKITCRTRRCKVCNLKNIRHETMYGCSVCQVNLCKSSHCFWDFHGFPSNHEGNAKIGFIGTKREDTRARPEANRKGLERGQRRSADVADQMDQEMAPLEDEDANSETETVDSNEKPAETAARTKGICVQSVPPLQPVKNKVESLSIHQRRILLLALCSGIQKAAKEMDTKPALIKTWINEKEEQLNECCSKICGAAVDHLVEWVLTQREQQRPLSEARLFEKASELQSQNNETNSFRISYEWAVNFMMQHKLGLDMSFTVDRELPNVMEENCRNFKELVHNRIQTNAIQSSLIGAMDQLSVFVDFNMLNEKNKIRRDTSFQFTGSGKPFVKIYLAMLANGTMLPAVLFSSRTTSALSNPSNMVLLMTKEEGYTTTEELEVWATKVWKQHLDSQNEKEALLILDNHQCQTSEDILSSVSSIKTFSATIPVGCTCRHQPLEMSVRPLLQRLFLTRWAQRSNDVIQPEDMMQLVVSWLDEAMSCFFSKPEYMQHAFCLAHVLPVQETHTNFPETSLELLNLLLEAILGPEVVDLESEDEDEPMDTHSVERVSQLTEKIDLTQDQEAMDQSQENLGGKEKGRVDEWFEISSDSTEFSHSSPEPESPSHIQEPDASESGQEVNTSQTDSVKR
ncbi:hypothetical protein DNTS_012149 [Danionella cerebrum]|uniref:Pogo transposable element derived with ZNF domain b n=1 Tax=Danionella cerebrum TaxID=2873325 RepID=A0A553Q8X0_9TELE|nr:hypothetical protein DNTS_012149 [Danionella translucida]